MRIEAKVIPGYGVASGKIKDSRYPKGTLAQQASYFKAKGLDLSPFYLGTLNVDVSPYNFTIKTPKHFYEQINWSEYIPPENFYFFDVVLFFENTAYQGLIYMPDPKTKTEHQQFKTTLELILPKIENLNYGGKVHLEIDVTQLAMH